MLVAVVVAHLAAALWLSPAGYLGIDEVTYDLMLENAAHGRLLEVWNGYEEMPSRELAIASLVIARGRLVAMPPPFYSLVAAPFYRLLGWRGAFVMNVLAFAGTLAVCWALAMRIYGRQVAWLSALVLALASFLPGYAQAGWPHAMSTLLVSVAVLTALVASRRSRGGWVAALASGALCSLAVGMRLDGIFVLPALLFIVTLTHPIRWRLAGLVLLGAAPGLVALALLNAAKFGSFSPFTYGAPVGYVSGVGTYLPVATLGAAVLMLLRLIADDAEGRWRRWAIAAGVASLAISIAFVGPWRQVLAGAWDGFLQLVVDLRFLPADVVQSAQTRMSDGAVVYAGGLKKALLQSCPYLPVALVAVCAGVRRRHQGLWVLLIPLLSYLGVYVAFAWHGGLAVNMRYWTVLLPFAAILTAAALREMVPRPEPALLGVAAAIAGLSLALFLLSDPSIEMAEPVLLTTPLWLAGLVLALSVPFCAAGARARLLGRAAALASAAALAWGAVVTHVYDLPWQGRQRAAALQARDAVGELLPRDSLLVTPFVVALRGAAKGRHVRIADPTLDGYAGLSILVRYHLAAGRPVTAALRDGIWEQLADAGTLDGLVVEPLWRKGDIVLARLRLGNRGG